MAVLFVRRQGERKIVDVYPTDDAHYGHGWCQPRRSARMSRHGSVDARGLQGSVRHDAAFDKQPTAPTAAGLQPALVQAEEIHV